MRKKTHVVAIADIKGGVGKTTTTMNIAGILARKGETVTVLDTDNTGGATLWAEYVQEENEQRKQDTTGHHGEYKLGFDVFPANHATLNAKRIHENYSGWVIIDTPPSDASMIQAAIDAADVTIIPCQPSISDLSHAGKTYSACRNAVILLTRVKLNTKLAKGAIAQLDEQGIPRFESVVREREFIKNQYGTTTLDNQDYASIVNELIDYINENEKAE